MLTLVFALNCQFNLSIKFVTLIQIVYGTLYNYIWPNILGYWNSIWKILVINQAHLIVWPQANGFCERMFPTLRARALTRRKNTTKRGCSCCVEWSSLLLLVPLTLTFFPFCWRKRSFTFYWRKQWRLDDHQTANSVPLLFDAVNNGGWAGITGQTAFFCFLMK